MSQKNPWAALSVDVYPHKECLRVITDNKGEQRYYYDLGRRQPIPMENLRVFDGKRKNICIYSRNTLRMNEKHWEMMVDFALGCGHYIFDGLFASESDKAHASDTKDTLKQKLCSFFEIKADPFEYIGNAGYKTKFPIKLINETK